MRAIIEPSQARGTVQAPPSKSMAHRMLMGAGLAEGVSHIKNIELSEDIKATLGILKALGCDYEFREKEVILTGIGNQKIQRLLTYLKGHYSPVTMVLTLAGKAVRAV